MAGENAKNGPKIDFLNFTIKNTRGLKICLPNCLGWTEKLSYRISIKLQFSALSARLRGDLKQKIGPKKSAAHQIFDKIHVIFEQLVLEFYFSAIQLET